MNVLLIGSGGREHALAWKLRQSPLLAHLTIAPGNPGTAQLGRNVPVAVDDVPALVALARHSQIDLVVVGPEVALAAGIADALAAVGIACFGPTQAAARIETSKAWSKTLMQQAGVPTGPFQVFADVAAAHAWVEREGWEQWRVVKYDGLAAGKGVIVAQSADEVHAAIDMLGKDGGNLLLEQPLEGEEISLLALCDGERAALLLPAQDHKRLLDGDHGPNTGGMGAYAPHPRCGPALLADLHRRVFVPTLQALRDAGTPFVGVLYAGVMLTADGPQVLEFNARWGDPETQALLPLLQSDLLGLMHRCTQGRLDPTMVRWQPGAACCVVLAAADYPAAPRRGDAIAPWEHTPNVTIFHAGTALVNGALVTAGGRILNVVGRGADMRQARTRAYAAAAAIDFPGKQMRTDIGARAIDPRMHTDGHR